MRKKIINIKDEEANSLKFLEKLNKFKKGAKEKTKSTVHNIEWVREYKTLETIESQLTIDLNESIKGIDKICSDTFGSLELFSDSKQNAKNFQEYSSELEKKNHLNEVNFWYQVRNFRGLVEELKKKNSELDANSMKELQSDVKSFFAQMQEIITIEYKNILKEREDHSELINQILNKQDEVSGFDKDLDSNLEIILGDKRYINQDILESIAPMKENYYHSLDMLDEMYSLEIERLLMDKKTSIPDFWTETMKEMFFHIYKTYIKRGKDRDVYMERLQMQFPGIPRKQIEIFDQFIVDNEYYNKKVKAIYRDWQKEKIQTKTFAEEQILNQIEYLIQETENELEKMKTNKELIRLQQIIEDQREEFELKKKEREGKLKKEREEEEKLKQIKEEKFKVHALDVKDKANKFVDDRKKKYEEARMINMKEAEQKKLEVLKNIEKNKPLVKVRQNNEIQKLKAKIEDKDNKQKEIEKNRERIEKAIENYANRPMVETDFNRVVQDTASLVSRKKTELDKADQVRLFRVNGFYANDLMKDMRYKISAALFDAGLQNTDYAKNLILQMSKPQQK